MFYLYFERALVQIPYNNSIAKKNSMKFHKVADKMKAPKKRTNENQIKYVNYNRNVCRYTKKRRTFFTAYPLFYHEQWA